MKYIYLSIIGLLFLVLIPFSVQAKDIEVTNVEVLEKNHYVSEVSSPSINEDKVDFNLKFEDYEQYITYKITVNNNSYYDYTYEINKKDESIISYEILDEENKINYSSTKDIVLKIWYKEEINEELYNDNKYNIEDKIELKFSGPEITSVDTIEELKKAIENPETGAFFSIIIALIVLIISIIVYKKAKSLSKFKHFIWIILLVPVIVLASSNTISIYLNFNIELNKPTIAMFQTGTYMNNLMKELSGESTNGYSKYGFAHINDGHSNFKKNTKIDYVKRSYELNENSVEVQTDIDSGGKIYMWYDSGNKTIYYYSDSIRLYYHYDSSNFYNGLTKLSDLNDIKPNLIVVASMMFKHTADDTENAKFDLSNWKVNHIKSTDNMFDGFGEKSKNLYINMDNWELSDVNNVSRMFTGFGYSATNIKLDLNNFTVNNIGYISDLFKYALMYSTGFTFNFKNAIFPDAVVLSELFEYFGKGSSEEIYLDISNFNAPKANTINKMFSEFGSNSDWQTSDYIKKLTIIAEDVNIPEVRDASYLFNKLGYFAGEVSLNIKNWNTSNFITLAYAFQQFANSSQNITIEGLNSWDVSNVVDMSYTFEHFASGPNKQKNIAMDLSEWKTDNLHNIDYMFSGFAYFSNNLNLDISNMNLSQISSATNSFYGIGEYNLGEINIVAKNLNLKNFSHYFINYAGSGGNIVNINLSNSIINNNTNISKLLYSNGYGAKEVNIDLSNIDFTDATSLTYLFSDVGYKAAKGSINMSGWNISNVTSLSNMFSNTFGGYDSNVDENSSEYELIGFEELDVSNVTNMKSLMYSSFNGANEMSFDLSNWNVSNVTDFSNMFNYVCAYSNNVYLNISGWETSSAETYDNMLNIGYGSNNLKIDINDWKIKNGSNPNNMFYASAKNVDINIKNLDYSYHNPYLYISADDTIKMDLSGWKLKNNMVYNDFVNFTHSLAYNAKSMDINLSNWNINSLTSINSFNSMFEEAFSSVTNTFRLNLTGWDVSRITSMNNVFKNCAKNSSEKYIIGIDNWNV